MADMALVLKINFELTEKDFGYFRDRFQDSLKGVAGKDEKSIIGGAKDLVSKALSSSPPDFVRSSIAKLEQFIAMLEDKDWKLEGDHRARVLTALAYFADPNDLIADATPGVGYLDDAIMIELVARDLADDLESYKEFLDRRRTGENPPNAQELAALREELHTKLALRYAAMERRLSGTRSPWRLLY
jgi:uncharacterized membrane protein YkvA (DUF1232 family)